MKRVAVIDLGTNTFHLLIAEVEAEALTVVHKEKISVKIGEGGITKGIITPPAQSRALNALKKFNTTLAFYQPSVVRATATSAFRNAQNGQQLVGKIRKLTGVELDIINGDKEAQYIYQGVAQAIDLGSQKNLILDIGGGSVELIIADNHEIHWKKSYEIGAQRLMDLFHHHDPITGEEIDELNKFLREKLVSLTEAHREFKPNVLVGSSGTFDTLSDIYMLKNNIVKTDIGEKPLTISGFNRIYHKILTSNKSERLAIPGMLEMRVDMIVVACCLINYLIENLELENIRVSAYALKEGLLKQVVDELRKSDI